MKRTIIILAFVFLYSSAFGQEDAFPPVLKYSSSITRLQTKEDGDSAWKDKDYVINHLIVFDSKLRKISIYRDDKREDFDIVQQYKPKKSGSALDYSWKCVDDKNRVCEVMLANVDGKPLFLRIDLNTYRIFYFITPSN